MDARRECVASERDTAPDFCSAATNIFVSDRRFSDRDGSPVRRRHVCVEPQAHELLRLCTVAVATSDAVDDRAGFGAREPVFRTERAVFITADPTKGRSDTDLLRRPVIRRHIAKRNRHSSFWR